MRLKDILAIGLLGALVMACKPTEQNYQAAYDVAKAKRDAQTTSEDGVVGLLDRVEGFHIQEFGDERVLVMETFVKPVEKAVPSDKKIGVAISKYSMATNANRQLNDLKATEPNAFVAIDGAGHYFVVIDVCDKLKEVPEIVKGFESRHAGYPYIGLPKSAAAVTISQ